MEYFKVYFDDILNIRNVQTYKKFQFGFDVTLSTIFNFVF
jgi:hypothetical protein